MKTIKLGVAATLAFGLAGSALAGVGSSDLSNPPGFETAAPREAIQRTSQLWGSAADAYGEIRQGFGRDDTSRFDRATGNSGG